MNHIVYNGLIWTFLEVSGKPFEAFVVSGAVLGRFYRVVVGVVVVSVLLLVVVSSTRGPSSLARSSSAYP